MKEATEMTYTIAFAVIFFTVLAVTLTMWGYRSYARRRVASKALNQFNEALSQAKMEVCDPIRKMIMIDRSGLMAAIENEIRNIEKLGVLQPVFRITGKPVMLEENKSLIIYRIVEEALHNVLKHAKATLLEMQIQFECDKVKLMIKDNGKGILGDVMANGRGLRKMRESARMIGAQFKLDSSTARGTLIMLTIPQ